MGKIYTGDFELLCDYVAALTKRGLTFTVTDEGSRWLISVTGD